ncbi:MAG: FAD-dependent oxidoreductase [Deltaproteobacteria bacterium]|nr:FAD-dependent oxidoreductase [Deltaproteobacteria bacterium]
MSQFEYLFSPLRIGNVTVDNRIVMMPATTLLSSDHLIGDRHIAYYAERAKGGAGLVIVETLIVHPSSQPLMNEAFAYDEREVPRYRELTKAVHAHGAKVFAQIAHGGRQLIDGSISRLPLLGVSPLALSVASETPHEMDEQEIAELIEAYATCAGHIRDGGFDGVELHASHGYLIQQFFSPLSNQRTDRWGGALENRMRFAFEVIKAVRRSAGDDFVLGLRLSADEFVPGGLTTDDTQEIARHLVATGQLNYLSVSAGMGQTPFLITCDMSFPPGSQAYLAGLIREVAGEVPVFASQRINDPILAERILAEGQADMVGMTRALIADPELPRKAREGRLAEIRACIGCNQNCIGRVMQSKSIGCIQNAAAGREREWGIGTLSAAPKRKRVTVIGGGPGGMECARILAERGHAVTLYEKAAQLGGQINLITQAAGRQEFGGVVRYLAYQMEKLEIDVRLQTAATAAAVLAEKPDAVVVATGSLPAHPELPGADGPNVCDVSELLAGRVQPGKRAVVIDGECHYRALTAADFLLNREVAVEVLSPVFFVGMNVAMPSLIITYMNLCSKGAVFTPMHMVRSIAGDSVNAFHVFSFAERTITDIDTVVFAYPGRADDALYKQLKGQVPELYQIGDCVAPRKVDMAILEGHEVGRRI